MAEFDRLDGSIVATKTIHTLIGQPSVDQACNAVSGYYSIGIETDFVEREQTPRELMKLSIQLQLCGLSLSDTVSI